MRILEARRREQYVLTQNAKARYAVMMAVPGSFFFCSDLSLLRVAPRRAKGKCWQRSVRLVAAVCAEMARYVFFANGKRPRDGLGHTPFLESRTVQNSRVEPWRPAQI